MSTVLAFSRFLQLDLHQNIILVNVFSIHVLACPLNDSHCILRPVFKYFRVEIIVFDD